MEERNPLSPYLSLIHLLEMEGYIDFFITPNNKLGCLAPYIYTWGLLEGLNRVSYETRWCYHSLQDARSALTDWVETKSGEPANYIRRV